MPTPRNTFYLSRTYAEQALRHIDHAVERLSKLAEQDKDFERTLGPTFEHLEDASERIMRFIKEEGLV